MLKRKNFMLTKNLLEHDQPVKHNNIVNYIKCIKNSVNMNTKIYPTIYTK